MPGRVCINSQQSDVCVHGSPTLFLWLLKIQFSGTSIFSVIQWGAENYLIKFSSKQSAGINSYSLHGLGHILSPSETQFSHLKNGDSNT